MFLIATFHLNARRASEMTSDGVTPFVQRLALVIREKLAPSKNLSGENTSLEINESAFCFLVKDDELEISTFQLFLPFTEASKNLYLREPNFAGAILDETAFEVCKHLQLGQGAVELSTQKSLNLY